MDTEEIYTAKNAAQVKPGYTVSIEYSFSDENNILLGSSEHSGEYTFRAGQGDALPGLEKKLKGAVIGETRKFCIAAKDAYGMHNPDLVQSIPRNAIPKDLELKLDNTIYINNRQARITAIDAQLITIDGNHPLAGRKLFFTAKITKIEQENEVEQESCACGGSCSCKDEH